MTKQMKYSAGIEQIPEGYKLEYGYVIPKEWKIVRFDKCFHRLTRKNAENNQNVLTISAQQGLISQLDYYNTLYASEDKTGYFLLQKGDFAYNKSYSTDYAYGAIKQLEKYEKGIVSPLYICFSANQGTNTDFYRQYFEAGRFNREIYKIAQEGARNHGLLNVSTPEFFSAALVYPPVAEQKKIAEILAQCDKVIELKEKCLEEERKKKQWLVERIFESQDSKQWQVHPFKDVCTFVNGRAYKQEELLTSGKYPVLRVGNLFTKSEWYYSDLELTGEKYIDNGDLIYAWSASFGPQIWTGGKVIYHYHIWKVVPSEVIDKDYLYQYFMYDVNLLAKEQQGGTMSHITKEAMERRMCRYPCLSKQKQIAKVLYMSDQKTSLLDEELTVWRKKKKSLMQLLLTGIVRVKP